MSDLRTAAQAVVDRWDTPVWKNAPATAVYINALRAALEAPQPEPVAWATKNGDGDYAMLFFDRNEAATYCDGEEPTPLGALTHATPPQVQRPLTDEQIAALTIMLDHFAGDPRTACLQPLVMASLGITDTGAA